MNWKFWQKATPAAVPVEPAAPVMSTVEQAIYDHFVKNEKQWTLRRWKVDDKPAIRADYQDVSIISRKREHVQAGGFILVTHSMWTAKTSVFEFSEVFAKEWHETLNGRLDGREHAEEAKLVTAIRYQLEQRFGVTVK